MIMCNASSNTLGGDTVNDTGKIGALALPCAHTRQIRYKQYHDDEFILSASCIVCLSVMM